MLMECRVPKNEPAALHNKTMLETEDMRLHDLLRKGLLRPEIRKYIDQLQAENKELKDDFETIEQLYNALKPVNEHLRSIIQNALVSLAIINMPVADNLSDVVTNDELMKVMAESFREALKGK